MQRSVASAPHTIAETLIRQRQALLERLFEKELDIRAWQKCHADLIDQTLRALYESAMAQAVQAEVESALAPAQRATLADATPESAPLAILATGGYGRQELAPYSDIDLTFIPLVDQDPFTERMVKHLFQSLMSVFYTHAKLKVGYAYRLLEDCALLDEKTRTGLLDGRFIAGNPHLAETFHQQFWATLDPTGFILKLYQELRARWSKQGEAILCMEPNLKEGRGGLRDRHTVLWMTQARFGVSHENAVPTLIAEKLLTPTEAEAMEQSAEWLQRTRAYLHGVSGEAREQMTLAKQQQIAERLGYDLSAFRKELFSALADHARLTERAIERLVRSPLVLGVGLDSIHLEVVPAPALERENAEWCLWVFLLAQKYRLGLSQAIEERIEATISTSEPPPLGRVGECLQELFRHPGEVSRVLEPMWRLGVLEWAIPALKGLTTLPAGDPTHEYTVGEHTLQAIRILDGFVQSSLSNVMEQVARPEVLYMALLLHDAGKGDPQRPHAEVGAEIADALIPALGWDEEAREDVVFLVRNHLLMAQTARQRDLHLPETIREFTRIVDNLDRLHMLYLLTCADTQAVGERIWTPAQASFLQELYRKSVRALEEGMPTETIAVGQLRKRLMRALAKHPIPEEQVDQHIQQMPSGYLLNTPPDQVSLHIHYIQRVRSGEGPVIEFHNAPESPYTELTLCTFDDPQPGLLSKIAGVLYALDVEVSSARVLTREDAPRVALDTLWLTARQRPLSINQCGVLEKALRKVLLGEQSVADFLREHQKDPDAPLQVNQLQIHDDASETYTVIDMQTPPDAGALYRASYALSRLGLNIHSARLGQWAGRTLLSFYCTDTHGNKVNPEEYPKLYSALSPITSDHADMQRA